MNEENKSEYSKASIKSKILVSFVLIIFILGIGVSLISAEVLHRSLQKAGIETALVAKISRDFNIASSGLVMVSIILAIIVAVALSKYLTRPINELRDAVEKMKEGSFEVKIGQKLKESGDEVGRLAVVFSRMAGNLNSLYKSLEIKVAERTKELEEAKKMIEGRMEESEKMNKLMVGREIRMTELKDKITLLEKEKAEKIN